MAHDNSILDLDKVFRLLFELNDLWQCIPEGKRAVSNRNREASLKQVHIVRNFFIHGCRRNYKEIDILRTIGGLGVEEGIFENLP